MPTEAVTSRSDEALLRLSGVSKSFPGVLAVRDASLEVRPGEILALVGENGAGKSTLIKTAAGAYHPDTGRVELGGRDLTRLSPLAVSRAGLAVIYQELGLVPALTVRENLFLGRDRHRGGVVDAFAETSAARGVLARLGLEVDLDTEIRDLDLAHQQLVEIARALLADARVLILDEPTAALPPAEVDRLCAVLHELRYEGLGLIYVSHRLDEVYRLADRIAVMRDGALLGVWSPAELPRERLIEQMVGRPLDREFPPRSRLAGDELLRVEELSGAGVHGANFAVRAGEVLGIAGLAGSGRTALARLLFGAEKPAAGRIFLDGQAVTIGSPREAIRRGIVLLTEDRKEQGLVLGLPARENFALGNLERWSRHGWIDRRAEAAAFAGHVETLDIRLSGPEQPAGELSGGNQQKLLVARWLERDARVVIFDEPTRGVDVGAKFEIHQLVDRLATAGKAVVMISSELPEVLGMSDRILVMHEGAIRGEVADPETATQESLLELAVGP